MAIRKASPKANYTQSADASHVIPDVSALSADPDLLAIDGKPKFAPQRALLINNTAAALAVAVFPVKGTVQTISVPANAVISYDHPIVSLDESVSGAVQVILFWWDTYGSLDWNLEA